MATPVSNQIATGLDERSESFMARKGKGVLGSGECLQVNKLTRFLHVGAWLPYFNWDAFLSSGEQKYRAAWPGLISCQYSRHVRIGRKKLRLVDLLAVP
jgi:hypothetical protein